MDHPLQVSIINDHLQKDFYQQVRKLLLQCHNYTFTDYIILYLVQTTTQAKQPTPAAKSLNQPEHHVGNVKRRNEKRNTNHIGLSLDKY
jgi:hypothetical protein